MSHQRSGYAVAHFLMEKGVDLKRAMSVASAVGGTADVLQADSVHFLRPLGLKGPANLKHAWKRAGGRDDEDPIIVDIDGGGDDDGVSFGLRFMQASEALALFSLAENRTFQRRLEERNPGIADWLAIIRGPTGTEMRHEDGQRLMHAIRVSMGDKAAEAPLAKIFGNDFARIICRNAKYCLYVHATHVLNGDIEATAASKELVDALPSALPIAYGTFRGATGPIFVVDQRGNAR